MRVEKHNGVEVVVPPRHHQIVTAKVAPPPQGPLPDAGRARRRARRSSTPRGRGRRPGWASASPGACRISSRMSRGGGLHLPFDRRAKKPALARRGPLPERPQGDGARGQRRRGAPAQRRPGAHPDGATRSSARSASSRSRASARASPGRCRRQGPAEGDGDRGRVPGAELIPDGAELFLGFTSTQRNGSGRADRELRDARARRPRAALLLPRRDAHAPFAHRRGPRELVPQFDFRERVDTTFRPGCQCRRGPRPCRSRRRASSESEVTATNGGTARSGTARRSRRPRGSSGTCVARTGRSTGRGRRCRSAPTSTRWTTRSSGARTPRATGRRGAHAGVHFVVFNPTSDDFHRNRLAMDGGCPTARGCRSSRARRARDSTRSCRRPTGRTSSSRPAGTARSRWSGCRS